MTDKTAHACRARATVNLMSRKQRHTAANLSRIESKTRAGTTPPGGSVMKELWTAGVQHHQAGRLAEAEACYRRLLAGEPNHIQARSNLGVVLKNQGKLDEAVAAYRQAIRIKPDYAETYSNLGNALKDQGKPAEAVAAHRQAIRIKPDYAEAHFNLGNALRDQGELNEAVAAYCQAIGMKPGYAKAYSNLGNALKEQGKVQEAFAAYRQAISIRPDLAEAHFNIGNMLNTEGKLDEAVAAYRQAIRVKPDYVEAYYNLGNALKDQDELAGAVAAYRRAIGIKADYAEAYSNLGVAFDDLDKHDEAVAAYRQAIRIKPDYAEAYSNLGNALKDQGKLAEAVAAHRQAISIKPDYAEAYSNLGVALHDQGKLEEAVAAYRQAISIKPDFAEAHLNLGNVLNDQGKLCEGIAAYRHAIEVKADYADAHSNLLFSLNYDDRTTVDQLFTAHQEWEARHGRLVSRPAAYANVREMRRRLKIGYVSPDFRGHSVAFFVEPLLKEHDRKAVEVFCYAEVRQPDALTAHLQRLADHWLVTVGLSDGQMAERIRADGIDILVDLAGHTANNRLRVFARKPAPIQVTWLGYPNTTGLKAIDYRLVDAVTDPVGEADAWASETLVRLEGGFLCYSALKNVLKDAPEPAVAPRLETGAMTFGSFNNPAKGSAATLDAWATLLSRLPQARLLLKGRPFTDAATRSLFLARLREHGVDAERVELAAWLPGTAAHLALYHQVDIALDPFPYNGTTTTCEALWMGVPVVTLRGDRHAGRVGASLLTRIGLTDLIADSVEEYLEIAVALAHNPERLSDLRRVLRPRVAASHLCDEPGFARKMEGAFRTMWQRWCNVSDRQ
jgi:protein O-GlcNAc transferase